MKPPATWRWFLRVLVAYARREMAAFGGYRAAFVLRVLGLVSTVASVYFMSRFVSATINPHIAGYGGNYLGFLVIGLLATGFQQLGVSDLAGRIRTAQVLGTLEAEIATPAPSWIVLGAPTAYEFAVTFVRSAGYLVGASLLLGLDLSHANWASLLVSVPLIVTAFTGLGLLAAGSTMLVRRTNPVATVIGSLSFFLSGVLYPVSVLPGWLQAMGALLPLTHALNVLRGGLLVGSPVAAFGGSLLALLAFAVVLAPTGAALFAYALRRARADGSLSHY